MAGGGPPKQLNQIHYRPWRDSDFFTNFVLRQGGGANAAEFDCLIEARQQVDIRSPVEAVIKPVQFPLCDLVVQSERALGTSGSIGIGTPGSLSRASGRLRNSNCWVCPGGTPGARWRT